MMTTQTYHKLEILLIYDLDKGLVIIHRLVGGREVRSSSFRRGSKAFTGRNNL